VKLRPSTLNVSGHLSVVLFKTLAFAIAAKTLENYQAEATCNN